MENIEKIKEDFENGKIKKEDIDIETQKKIAELYKSEIEKNRQDIIKIREEIKGYRKEITRLKEDE